MVFTSLKSSQRLFQRALPRESATISVHVEAIAVPCVYLKYSLIRDARPWTYIIQSII